MTRRKFLAFTGSAIVIGGATYYGFSDKNNLVRADIKQDFDDAYEGIKKLPKAAKMGVYLAYIYYLELFKKIKNAPATTIMQQRIRVGDTKKMRLLCAAYLKFKITSL